MTLLQILPQVEESFAPEQFAKKIRPQKYQKGTLRGKVSFLLKKFFFSENSS